MVNATRDATRHAEIIAVDRMLTGAIASDQLCLPKEVMPFANNNDDKNDVSSYNVHAALLQCQYISTL